MKKPLTLSIIIPVYNEERRLRACLDAIKLQKRMPDEVIVVDNNSTDSSAKIAKKYKFVTVLHESKQGLIFARNRGLDAARGDILARIDADTMIPPNWCDVLVNSFDDKNIAGVTGPSYSLLLPRIRWPMTTGWTKLYFLWTHIFYRVPVLWGANMAIRRTAWKAIRHDVCLDDKVVHEDQDISLLLQSKGGRLKYNDDLCFTSYSQAYHYFPKLVRYTVMRHTTRNYHRKRGTFATIQPDMSRLRSVICYTIGFPIIFLFFFGSFIVWPIDALMKAFGKQQEWLS